VVFVNVALEGSDDLLLQNGRTGVAEDTDAELKVFTVPTFSVDEDLDVTGLAIAGHDAGDCESGGRFARGFRSDLRNRTYGKTIFKHGADRYMRFTCQRSRALKEFTHALRRREQIVLHPDAVAGRKRQS